MCNSRRTQPILLMVDDDEEDIYLIKRAFCAQDKNIIFRSVQSSVDFFEFLHCNNKYSTNTISDLPDLVLLDINIPKKNGFEILEILRKDDQHKHLPVIMLTTSTADHDISKAYSLGANCYISKTVSAEGVKTAAEIICSYWFDFVKLPSRPQAG